MDKNDDKNECIVCMSNPRNTLLEPCKHVCLCAECAEILRNNRNACPICRGRTLDFSL
jgi:E3 ubiquitin-protein ligase MGRN1